MDPTRRRQRLGRVRAFGAAVVCTAVIAAACGGTNGPGPRGDDTTRSYQTLREDKIVNADIWETEPRMMAAGLGFTAILGVPDLDVDEPELSESLTRRTGGTWNVLECLPDQEPALANYTSAATPDGIARVYGGDVYFADGLPIEFSWPILPSTLDATDFEITLNTGAVVTPEVASIWPNFEYNERSVAVVFGYFGNRIGPSQPGALYPTRISVVEDDSPLRLVGPDGRTESAVGLAADAPGSPYTDPDVAPDARGGPRLVAAKLSKMSTDGDTGPRIFGQNLPNDGVALYGEAAEYRLRVYTSGGMTPDGVRGVFPTDYSRFFRLRAETPDGDEVLITAADVDYDIGGKKLRVLGLADLGKKESTYTDCYGEDKDNYIDIVLTGDEAAVRAITHVQIPSTGEYDPLFNPGGPGNDPTPDVRYSAPSPPINTAVINALDDPMTVTYPEGAEP